MTRKSNAGFTLIELMIVIEIIAIICAMAIPTLMRQRIQTREAAAVQNLRSICTAVRSRSIPRSSATVTSPNSPPASAARAHSSTTRGARGVVRSEYIYNMTNVTPDTFIVTAAPQVPGRSGIRTYWVDESGDIKYR